MKNGEAVEYYRRREQQERELAESARNGYARRVHLTLADRYAKLAQDAAGDPGVTLK